GAKKSVESLLGSRFQSDGSVSNLNNVENNKIEKLLELLNKHFTTETNDILFTFDKISDRVFFKTESDDINNSNFVKQFFQHNPDTIKHTLNINDKVLTNILTANRA